MRKFVKKHIFLRALTISSDTMQFPVGETREEGKSKRPGERERDKRAEAHC